METKLIYGILSLRRHNCICGVIVDCGFEPWSGQTKNVKFVFAAAHLSTLHLGESKDWLAPNQDNVSEWSDMSPCRLPFQSARNRL